MSIIKNLIKRIIPKKIFYLYITKSRKWYSQIGQDFWVFGEVFNEMKNGFFIEIGSSNGVTFNNTFLLEAKYKWRGICIEADPLSYEYLRWIRRNICVNICIDKQKGSVDFIQQGLSSSILSLENKKDNLDGNIITIESETLDNILKKYNCPQVIDYLSIDVEGAEERILGQFCFDKYIFNCVTIERPSVQLRLVLAQNGYIIIKEFPDLDVFYIHQSFLYRYQKNSIEYWKKNKDKRVNL
jgi:FkbM family methyltransferase